MCGICGVVNFTGEPVQQQLLQTLADRIAHRGPDDAGYFTHGAAGLGHRRLSIIDLAGGHQPLTNEDGTVWIVFNGEIYNLPDLRAQLETRGHVFQTHSDTEAIVHAYEEWGEECPRHLRGMFAFAIYDVKTRSLFLARDRIGKKPLLYWHGKNAFVFASEFQALLAHPSVPRAVNFTAIDHYLASYCVPSPETAFAGIHKLPPGHTLTLQDGTARLNCYWSLAEKYEAPRQIISEAAAADELWARFSEAVRVRLTSEVPLGAFLSGGIDSSALVAAMAEQSGRPVKTFNVNFDDQRFSEAAHARRVAEKYGCEHTEIMVRPDAAAILPTLVRHYGEPFADSSAVPTYYVSQATRQHATVALNGDGGDEVFAGYDRYRALRLTENLPGWLRACGGIAEKCVPGSLHARSRRALLKRLLQAAALPAPKRYLRWHSALSAPDKSELYSTEFQTHLGSAKAHPIALWIEKFPHLDPVARAQLCDSMTYLPNDLLVKLDIASMACSLEARSPFLDHELMEWAATLPSELKLRGSTGKFVLREAIRDKVPLENVARRKMGFMAPASHWLRGDLREMLSDTVLSSRALGRGYFQPKVLRAMVDDHLNSRADNGLKLWTLLMLELWHLEFLP